MINLNQLLDSEIQIFLDSFDTVISDCDGVLWHDDTLIPGASEVVNDFAKLGKNIYYVTNNSTKTRQEFLEKCKKLNFPTHDDCILTPSFLIPKYLKEINFKKKVYLIGSAGIANELKNVGIPFMGLGPDPAISLESLCTDFTPDPDVGAVILGYDVHFNYLKLMKAATYLQNKDVLFLATNTDKQISVKNNIILPGTGSLVQCVETCSLRKATIIGKPSTFISEALIKNHQINPSRTIMIGDLCSSDILFGKHSNFLTLLVLTGVTTEEQLQNLNSSQNPAEQELLPVYYTNSISDLLPHLQKNINK